MNFDVRRYCERIAKAMPEQFKFVRDCPDNWVLGLPSGHLWADADVDHFWAFIGPLADELGVQWYDMLDGESLGGGINRGESGSLLEATFAAVCEKLEAAKEEAV